MYLEEAVAQAGGVASTTHLALHGFTTADARAAVARGALLRIRQGWVALPSAPDDVVRAVRVGGQLTCISLLRQLEVWCHDDHRLHVAVGRHTSHLSSPDARGRPLQRARNVAVHRVPDALGLRAHVACVPIELALLQLFGCQLRDDAIAALDSALNLKLTTRARLDGLAVYFPQRYRAAIALTDPRAQSGLETKARLRLRSLNIPYRTQVHVPVVGLVDLVIGDRIVLELDGARWHTSEAAFFEDRRRDLILHEREYTVIRLTYAQVMYEWPRVERMIRAAVERNEHRWSARQRRRLQMGGGESDLDAFHRASAEGRPI
ncbi:endonuclease domain-containing protein [Subtercola sp. PAMC28395]|uniref:endonuclease domain-containing protein n=1 Tax=Subtercola sp. PAMC28395 TaxID=2846775 RepID=UPI001C0D9736|nr:DUF559 domain-containing protein [Subtercola sp. PAMC28395]QWT22845.1 endonuclease domain-containing protein [Subtercola sp. PAMC28395]